MAIYMQMSQLRKWILKNKDKRDTGTKTQYLLFIYRRTQAS